MLEGEPVITTTPSSCETPFFDGQITEVVVLSEPSQKQPTLWKA